MPRETNEYLNLFFENAFFISLKKRRSPNRYNCSIKPLSQLLSVRKRTAQTERKILAMSTSELENSDFFLLSQAILAILISTPAVVTNVLLLITVFRDPSRNQPLLRSPVTLLVVNLAMCDLITGAIPCYGSFYYNIALFTGQPKQELFGLRMGVTVTGVVANVVSSCTIAAMSFDRLFAVSSPHQYNARVTKAKIKAFIVVAWIYSLFFSSLTQLGLSITVAILLYCHIHMSIPLVILPVVYWKTYRALRLHNNEVRNLTNGREQIDLARKRRERKMVSAFLLVLISFYVTFMPQYIAQNIYLLFPSVTETTSYKFFLYASNKFVVLNCSLNPFIYAWRVPKYKRAFMAVFGRCVCRSRNAVSDS